MSRKYVKIDEHGKEIIELKRKGKTSREITQKLGVDRECIRNWVFRFNRQQASNLIKKADHERMLSQGIL